MTSPETILIRVASRYGVPVQEIRGKRRFSQIVLARHVAIWLMHEYGKLSYGDLGHYFGIDHASAMHAVKKIQKLMRWDATAERAFRSILDSDLDEEHGSGI